MNDYIYLVGVTGQQADYSATTLDQAKTYVKYRYGLQPYRNFYINRVDTKMNSIPLTVKFLENGLWFDIEHSEKI